MAKSASLLSLYYSDYFSLFTSKKPFSISNFLLSKSTLCYYSNISYFNISVLRRSISALLYIIASRYSRFSFSNLSVLYFLYFIFFIVVINTILIYIFSIFFIGRSTFFIDIIQFLM